MISKIIFHAKNTDIIANLNEAANRITEQEEIINRLQEKIEGEKEVLKGELEVDYNRMEEIKDRYIDFYYRAPFHFTEEELRDYNDFRDNHKSSIEIPDEEGNQICSHADGFSMPITFYWTPNMSYHKITVECPYCHTKRELGLGIDILDERENCVNEE